MLKRRDPSPARYYLSNRSRGDVRRDRSFAPLNAGERARRVRVLIVGRGGGSLEVWFAFNDGAWRAILPAAFPVVSAVGRERTSR